MCDAEVYGWVGACMIQYRKTNVANDVIIVKTTASEDMIE